MVSPFIEVFLSELTAWNPRFLALVSPTVQPILHDKDFCRMKKVFKNLVRCRNFLTKKFNHFELIPSLLLTKPMHSTFCAVC